MKFDLDEKTWNYYQRVNPAYLETTSRDKIMMLSKIIKRYTSNTDYLCEVGLGNGLMLKELARSRRVMGVDLSKDTIVHLKSKPDFSNIELRDGDICRLSTVSQDMDAVITIDVIEHLTSDQLSRAYKEIHKVLKMEGKWFINVPWNEDLKLTEVFCPHCHKTFHRFGHKQSFDEAKLNAILVQANFQVAFIKKIYPANFMLPAPLMWLYRIIARIYLKNYASMFAMAIKDGDIKQSRIKNNSAS